MPYSVAAQQACSTEMVNVSGYFSELRRMNSTTLHGRGSMDDAKMTAVEVIYKIILRDSSGARLCVDAARTCQKAHHFLSHVP